MVIRRKKSITERIRDDEAELVACGLNLRDRQLVLWESLSAKSDIVTMSLDEQCRRLSSRDEPQKVRRNMAGFVRAGFYKYDSRNDCYRRVGPPGETKLARFHRVARSLSLNVALRWKLLRLTANKPAPHSVVQFAAELGREASKVSRVLKGIAAESMFNRYGGAHGFDSLMTWVRADDESANFNLLERELRRSERKAERTEAERAERAKRLRRSFRLVE